MKRLKLKSRKIVRDIVNALCWGLAILTLVFVCPYSVEAMLKRMVLRPIINPAGTGTVNNMFVDDTTGNVGVGDPIFYLPVRGWIEFGGYRGTSGFWSHPEWKITSATLRIYVTDSNSTDCDIRIHSLQDYVNPSYGSIRHLATTGNTIIWNQITQGPALNTGYLGKIPDGRLFDIPLDPKAVETMLKNTSVEYVGIGIREHNDDDDELKFSGWSELNPPQLIIKYNDASNPMSGILKNILDDTLDKPNDGLTAYYKFDGNTYDSSGRGNNGTAFNSVSYVSGRDNQAGSFDGVNDYVRIDNKLAFNSGDFTIAAWVKASQEFSILSQWTASSTADNFIFELLPASNSLYLAIRQQGSGTPTHLQTTTLNIPSDQWVFVAVTYEEYDGNCVFYVNNQSQTFFTGFSDRTIDNSAEIYVGRKRYLDSEYTQGSIDELRVYNRVLSQAEIQNLANQ